MSSESDAQQPRILIVEDHHETLVFLRLALGEDYELTTVVGALDALDVLSEERFDLLLVDIALRDEIDGIELVNRLRQRPEFADTPIVAMTAHKMDDEREYYLSRGFDAFLPKPFLPDDLFKCIDHLLDESRSDGAQPTPTP